MSPSREQPGFARLNVVPRSTMVREQLEQALARGDYRPGEMMPSERELAEMFGVSRVSVREAIRSLEAVGLVEVQHGKGTIVTDPSTRAGRDLSRWIAAHRAEVLELLRVRAALDELAGEEAAARHDEQAIAAIRAAHEQFVQAAQEDRRDALATLDKAFHLAVADAAGSDLLHNLLAELHNHLTESRAVFFAPNARSLASAKEHAAILAAIEKGDGAAARRATKRHIASVRKVLEQV